MPLQDFNTRQIADEGIDIPIHHPVTGLPLGIVITMLGSDSQVYMDAVRADSAARLARARKTRDMSAGLAPEELEASLVARMTACFLGWQEEGQAENTIEIEPGRPLPGTRENFRTIIEDRGFFWLRQQIQQEMDDVANFLPQPQAGSSPPQSSVSTMTSEERTV